MSVLLRQLCVQVLDIAFEAGEAILAVYAQDFSVERKPDQTPLTEADLAANRVIEAGLTRLNSAWPILSEESNAVPYDQRVAWPSFWLVDPLDGTKEFIKRNGEFTVNVALIESGRPVLGVVYAPVARLAYFAATDIGAWKQAGDARPQRIAARNYAGGSATIAGSRSHAGPNMQHFIDCVRAREGEPKTLSLGSALKTCLVAEGAADIYPRFGPTNEWDTAAAQCVLENAGGRVLDLAGRTLAYNKPSVLNPWFIAVGAGDYDWSPCLPTPS